MADPILYFPKQISPSQEKCIIDSILRRQVAFLTGYFGNNKASVQRIARNSRAVMDAPLLQIWSFPQSRHKFIPSYTLVFGQFRHAWCSIPELSPNWSDFHDHFKDCSREMEDLEGLMIGLSRLPVWDYQGLGTPYVPMLGNIKQKPVDFAKWLPHVHQLPIWYGTSIPSRASQRKQFKRGRSDGKLAESGPADALPQSRPADTLPQSRLPGAGDGEPKGKAKARPKRRPMPSRQPEGAELQPALS